MDKLDHSQDKIEEQWKANHPNGKVAEATLAGIAEQLFAANQRIAELEEQLKKTTTPRHTKEKLDKLIQAVREHITPATVPE